MTADPVAPRVLTVTAHPDDVDFGAAGTVARLVSEGSEVTYCVVTDGDAGGFDPAVPRSEMPRIRRAEQTAAAKAVGVQDLVFLGYPDGRVETSLELRRDISRVIRQVRPDRVICQSPERLWMRIGASHPDHLAAGEATIAAVYPDSRNPFAHPELAEEGLEAHTVAEIWLMASPRADTFVDVTEHFDQKVTALLCHASQHPDPSRIKKFVGEWMGATAEQAGFAAGRVAEAFQRVPTP